MSCRRCGDGRRRVYSIRARSCGFTEEVGTRAGPVASASCIESRALMRAARTGARSVSLYVELRNSRTGGNTNGAFRLRRCSIVGPLRPVGGVHRRKNRPKSVQSLRREPAAATERRQLGRDPRWYGVEAVDTVFILAARTARSEPGLVSEFSTSRADAISGSRNRLNS